MFSSRISRAAFAGGFLIFSSVSVAGGSVGVDYLSNEVSISGFRDSNTQLESAGPGVSLAWDLSENWTINFSHSNIDSGGAKETSTNRGISVEVDSESSSNGVGLSYYGDSFWAGLRYRQSEDEQRVRGSSRVNPALGLDIDQLQDSQSVTFEVGKDWLMGNWSPAVSLSISQQSLDIDRVERLDTLNVSTIEGLQESLSGVDFGISASIAYYFQLSDSVLLAPTLGIFHRSNLSGDVSGLAAYSQSRGDRTIRASQDYREKLNTPEDTSLDFGLNLLAGDWLWSIGTFTGLSSDAGSSGSGTWFAGLSYAF